MIGFVKKYVPHETGRVIELLIIGIIILIPFSVRHVFYTRFNFRTGAYSDFTSISLYLSDLLIIAVIILGFRYITRSLFTTWYGFLIIWLVLLLFAAPQADANLETYFIVRISALFILALVISAIKLNKQLISWAFVTLGFTQSLIAIYQFYTQKSLGLYILGESHLSPQIDGIAKIVSHGTRMIRSYGTFPHSNLLSAFLVVTIALNLYLLTNNYQQKIKLVLSFFLITNIFGLFLTFSRAGIAAGGAVAAGFILVSIFTKQYQKLKQVIIPLVIGLILSIGLLSSLLTTRATISDSAVRERVFYNRVGLKIIKANPFLGIGPGISVLHMEQYSGEDLQPWEIQPIHNFYLISIAEWGIAGIIFLLGIIVPILWLCWITLKNLDDFWKISLSLIGLAFLFLFMFDHYFYTIWPTQLLLWLMIGLMIKEIQRKAEQN